MAPRRVLVIPTGGTIGSEPVDGVMGFGENGDLARAISTAQARSGVEAIVEAWRDGEGRATPPMDSGDIGPEAWTRLAEQIRAQAAAFDGVVVLHGTDTLAYTGAALTFALLGLGKPVVLSGAQRVPAEPRSDAVANLALAFSAAAGGFGPLGGEVVIAFGGRIMRASRAYKHSTERLTGFRSENHPMMSGRDSPERRRAVLAAWAGSRGARPQAWTAFDPAVLDLPAAPAQDRRRLHDLVRATGAKAVVFRLFGVGAAPAAVELPALCDALAADGVLPVAVTACRHGRMAWDRYASSGALASSALVFGGDMTPECALVKTMWALAGTHSLRQAARLIADNVAGELTSGAAVAA